MASYKITIDDDCVENLEGQRAKLQAVVTQASADGQAPPWFAPYIKDVAGYCLYVLFDHCRSIARQELKDASASELATAVAGADAHIVAAEGSAEEI